MTSHQTGSPSRNLRPAIALAAALGFAALAVLAPSQAAARVTMTAEIGFGERGKPGRWLPVFVTLTNEPEPGTNIVEDFLGRVEFVVDETLGARGVTYSAEVQLPANSRKRVPLYVKVPARSGAQEPMSSSIHLLRPNGSEALAPIPVDAKNLKFVDSVTTPLVVALQARASAQRYRTPEPLRSNRDQRDAVLDPQSFPDSWIGLDAVDVLVVPRMTSSMLSPAQMQALKDWVRMGGRLLVYGGTESGDLAESPLADMLPVEPFGSSQRSFNEPFFNSKATMDLASVSEPRPGARVLYSIQGSNGDPDIPLAWSWRQGLGEVHFWAYSARLSQSENWIKRLEWALWESLARQNYQEFLRDAWREKFSSKLSDNGVLENAAKPPNVAYVIALIFIYFVAVGPANFIILRKRRRLELAWVTIPAIVLVFSAGMYTVGRLTKGNENLRRDLILIQAEANHPEARVVTSTAFFSAGPLSVSVEPGTHQAVGFSTVNGGEPSIWTSLSRSEGLLQPVSSNITSVAGAIGSQAGGGGFVAASAPARIQRTADGLRLDQYYANQWSWSGFEGEGLSTLGGSGVRSVNARHHGDRLDGEVVNASDYDLRDVFVVTLLSNGARPGSQFPMLAKLSFGDLKRGGSLRLDQPLAQGNVGPGRDLKAISNPDSQPLEARFKRAIEERFLKTLVGLGPYPRGRALLFARVDAPDTAKTLPLGATAHQSSSAALLVVNLPLRPVPGALMPYGHATVFPVGLATGVAPTYSPESMEIAMEDNAVTFRIESPFEPGEARLVEATIASGWESSKDFTLTGSIDEYSPKRPAPGEKAPSAPSFAPYRGPRRPSEQPVSRFATSLDSAMAPSSQSLFIRFNSRNPSGKLPPAMVASSQALLPSLEAKYDYAR